MYKPEIPALEKKREEDEESEVSLRSIERVCLENVKKGKRKKQNQANKQNQLNHKNNTSTPNDNSFSP